MKTVSAVTRFVDRVSIFILFGAFITICVISAGVYTVLGHIGHGLQLVGNSGGVSFLDSLYFSIVTISSLGYGDIHPEGFSRVIACAEVIAGLVIIGLVISKIASERSGYLLRRLYSSDVQQRLKYFEDAINRCEQEVSLNAKDLTELINESFGIIDGVKRFIGFEVYHGAILNLVPPKAFQKLVLSISNLLNSLVSQALQQGVTGKSRKTLKNMLNWSKRLARTLSYNSTNQELIDLCENLIRDTKHHLSQMKTTSTVASTG